MAGLVPAIHALQIYQRSKDVDARHKAGHDDFEQPSYSSRQIPSASCAGRSEIPNNTASPFAVCE
jgi:hypothetical protein